MRGMAGVSGCGRSGDGKNIFGVPIDERYKQKSRRCVSARSTYVAAAIASAAFPWKLTSV
jgi:hypothetical protein